MYVKSCVRITLIRTARTYIRPTIYGAIGFGRPVDCKIKWIIRRFIPYVIIPCRLPICLSTRTHQMLSTCWCFRSTDLLSVYSKLTNVINHIHLLVIRPYFVCQQIDRFVYGVVNDKCIRTWHWVYAGLEFL